MNHDNSDKIGNEYWKLRSRSGREKLFSTPDILLEAVNKYFEYVDEHPFYKPEQKKGNIIIPRDSGLNSEQIKEATHPIVDIPTIRPYTWHGLCLFLGVNTKYFNDFKERLRDKLKDENDADSLEFAEIITHIEDKIYQSQSEGAILGAFNPMIVTRMLGLKDRTDLTTNDNEIQIAQIKFSSE